MYVLQIILLIVTVAGFFSGMYCHARLPAHVSPEAVSRYPADKLFKQGIPPGEVLTERGQRLRSGMLAGYGVFGGGIVLMLLVSKLLGPL